MIEAVLDFENSDDGLRPDSFGVDLLVDFADIRFLLLGDSGCVLGFAEVFVLGDLESAFLTVIVDDGSGCSEKCFGVEVFASSLSLGTSRCDERRNLLWCDPDC